MSSDDTPIGSLLELAHANDPVVVFDSEHQVALVPDGWKIQDLSPFLPPPPRIQQRFLALDAASFIEYAKAYAESPAIFADEDAGAWSAILDHHPTALDRGACDHTVRFEPPWAPEFFAWLAHSGQPKSHTDFVRFLEDRGRDIASHPAGAVFDAIRSLDVKSDAAFSSEITLTTGAVKFALEENIRGTSRGSFAEIPSEWTVVLPPYLGLKPRGFTCRLRYRVKDRSLSIWYEIVEKDSLVRTARRDMSDYLREGLPNIPLYAGRLAA